jgi:hypothetical protein
LLDEGEDDDEKVAEDEKLDSSSKSIHEED